MKICYICGEYPPGPQGGIGTVVQLAAKRFVQKGHQVKVIGVYNDDRYTGDHFLADGVEVYRIRETGKTALSFFKASYRQYKQIEEWVDKGEIDIIEAPESRGWFAFWPKMNIPCVLRAHGSETHEKLSRGLRPNALTEFLEKQSYNRADAYSAVSNYAAKAAREVFGISKPMEVIYNGIEMVETPQQVRSNNSLVFAGSLIEKKGIITLIHAAIELYEHNAKFTLDIYGKDSTYKGGSMVDYLKSLMPVDLLNAVNFRGPVKREELFEAYSRCTIAIFPSQWESFGLAPIEAMMCGCPVIHTTIPTGYELIEDGIDGLLVDPYDFHELAKKIKLLLDYEGLRKSLGEKGIVKVRNNFTLDVMCNKLMSFYEQTINNFKG